MRVLVIGATGATGRAAVDALLAKGHEVTAFARRPEAIGASRPRLSVVRGDVMEPADVERAVEGQEAVVVILGISESPLLVRLRGSRRTPMNVRSEGTRNVVAAMRKHGVNKLVVQTTYGVGETRGRLPLAWKLIFALLLKPQIADTEVQEAIVRESGLDWILVQPVGLTDGPNAGDTFVSTDGDAQRMSIPRASVAEFLAQAAESARYTRRSVALSTAA